MEQNVKRILDAIEKCDKDLIIIGIDGRCASGKTTLANEISKAIECNVFHADDFFLRPEQRTSERLNEPGANLDRERFISEIIEPLKEKKPFSYRPFQCYTMSLGAPVSVEPKRINIIEGSYSCQACLRDNYDLRVFLNITHEKQLERLWQRMGTEVASYIDRWIPLEERYFKECEIEKYCDIIL